MARTRYTYVMEISIGSRVRHTDGYPVTGTVLDVQDGKALVSWDGERNAPAWYKVRYLRVSREV